MQTTKKYYTLSEAAKFVDVSKHDKKELCTLINTAIGKIIAVPLFELSTDKTFIENVYCCVYAKPDLYIFVTYWKQFEFVCYNRYEYCDANEMERVNKQLNLAVPAGVGKPTEKKILDWCAYIVTLQNAYKTRNEENKEKIDKFVTNLKSLYPQGDIYSGQGVKDGILYFYKDGSGVIRKNKIEYKFSIYKGSGFVDERITLEPISPTLENFKKLSDNKFGN